MLNDGLRYYYCCLFWLIIWVLVLFAVSYCLSVTHLQLKLIKFLQTYNF